MLRRIFAALALTTCAFGLIGCPETEFPDEGSGQPSDRATGKAPPGSIGACRVPQARRPPIINEELWKHLPECNRRSPRRYLRVGYSNINNPVDDEESLRMRYIMQELKKAHKEPDGNTRMLMLTRAVQQAALKDPKLAVRVERASGRTFACDYAYLLHTTEAEYAKVQSDNCPAYAYDPRIRRDNCMFDLKHEETHWLASGWACLAFTDTLGEGESCHRLCAYDDYCSSQIGCAQPDFELVMCALGVCTPEKVAGLY